MATFYPCSTNQRDAMANLYSRDPTGHAMYSESAVNGNMAYLNYSFGPYSEALSGNMQSQPSCIGFTDLVTSHLSENAYSSWRDGRNEMLFLHENGESIEGDDAQMEILNEHNMSLQQPSISNVQNQGLSLSLGTQIPVSSFKYQSTSGNGRIMDANVSTFELTGITGSIPNSKYLKTAQQLLDEVVNVQRALKKKAGGTKIVSTSGNLWEKDNDGESKSDGSPSNNHAELVTHSSNELSASDRQEFQNKMTKLLSMLDEVDRRYKQYYHQMQIVVSSFDSIAGSGAAKSYTALALQTISRHFRSLRDAISDQIRCTRQMLGESDALKGKGCGISRLRYVDQHIRQQRAIQQLGMMPQHAWRPQRGLPENSVTVLRAWLFEHFLHPYPNDSEKLMLSRQTGLTRSQVSNWFINARVRLWKPMVEDMYKEEFGETEMDSNSSSDNPTKFRDEAYSADVQGDQTKQPSHELSPNLPSPDHGFHSETQYHRQQNGLHDAICHADRSSRFIDYPMEELARYSNGGVSLELGLQHRNGSLRDSAGQQGFLAVRGDDIYSTIPLMGFSSSNPLHDFVA